MIASFLTCSANIFLVCHILLLVHSPKGSWNKLENMRNRENISHVASDTVRQQLYIINYLIKRQSKRYKIIRLFILLFILSIIIKVMSAIVIVSSRDNIRITFNIRNTSVIITITIFSTIIRIIIGNIIITEVFNYILIAVILIFTMVIIITLINIMKYHVTCTESYTFKFRQHAIFSWFLT